ncbi:MAG: doxx family protein [Bacteroidetes bacterium]|nr:doxx family protein [Bacteroidota bacterium]
MPRKLNLTRYLWFCRISFFVVYFWFGILKFFHGLSPAEGLAMNTLEEITFHTIPCSVSIYILASWEVLIAIGFLVKKLVRITTWLMIIHMILTFSTFIFFPDEMFTTAPYGLTLVSQYVIKNLVFISTGLLILKLPLEPEKEA